MVTVIKQSCISLAYLTLLTGVVYPIVVTACAQVLFPHQSNGSLILQNDKVVGSRLIGQEFASPKYFWGRLSATAPFAYNAEASSGSNLGPTNPLLREAAKSRVLSLLSHPCNNTIIPVDLFTASGSGLDPHISVAAAEFQAQRVADSRGLDEERVLDLIRKNTEMRQFGVLGEPRVNVLLLNLALDSANDSR